MGFPPSCSDKPLDRLFVEGSSRATNFVTSTARLRPSEDWGHEAGSHVQLARDLQASAGATAQDLVEERRGADFARRRQLLVFDRFLARIVATVGEAAMLKGGLVIELRLERARTTKDVDLRMVGSPDDLLAKLQQAGRLALGDFMTFEVVPGADEMLNDAVQYDGLRFRAECRLAGKLYGQPFGTPHAPELARERFARSRAPRVGAGARRQAASHSTRTNLHVP
jgi:hypothetical protein